MRRLAFGAIFGIAILAACGGGGGGGTSPGGSGIIPAGPTTTPAPTTSSQGFSNTNAVAIPSAAPGALSVPVALASDASGASANASLPASASVPADTTIAVTYASTGDASLPALSAKRKPSTLTVRDEVKKDALAFLKVQFSADVTLAQAPGFTFTVPGTVATTGVSYWLAFYDPLRAAAGWQEGFEGPATVAPTTVNGHAATTFTFPSNGKPVSFVAGQTYWFAVIAIVASAPTPTPVPTTVPTNAPPSGKPSKVIATPPNVQFSSLTSAPVPVTFTETGYAGNFSLHGDCTGIVNTSGASPTFTLTPVGQGRCVIVAIGDRGASAVVHVGVITPFETPRPTTSESPEPSHSPKASPSPEPSESPEHSPRPSASPEPSEPPEHSPSPNPSHSPQPTHSPEPTEPPEHSPSPNPSHSPQPTHAPTATPSPVVSHSPTATTSPSATPTPTH